MTYFANGSSNAPNSFKLSKASSNKSVENTPPYVMLVVMKSYNPPAYRSVPFIYALPNISAFSISPAITFSFLSSSLANISPCISAFLIVLSSGVPFNSIPIIAFSNSLVS